MGYDTNFRGVIEFDKEISQELADEINIFCEKRHCKGDYGRDYSATEYYAPDLYCNWEVSPDRKSLEWNGAEKSYSMEEWLPILIRKFLIPNGIVCNGEVEAQGERVGDHWLIKVTNNNVEVKQASFI